MTQNAWKCVIAVSLFSACTLAPVPLVGQNAVSVVQPVQVVNTPNVNVINTPSVNVANTPTVSLAGGASVNVTNPLDGEGNPTPLAVLDAVQPYEDSCEILFSGSNGGGCLFQTIPSGKRLVIQEFDARGILETGLKPEMINIVASGPHVTHFFTATFMASSGGSDWFATHQETRLYMPASEAPECGVVLTSNSNGSYDCQLDGFLVDVPLDSSSALAPVQPHRVPTLPNGRNLGLGGQRNNTER